MAESDVKKVWIGTLGSFLDLLELWFNSNGQPRYRCQRET